MRKKVAIYFLLLANIILLVHTVLPHHHHTNGTVCFFTDSCNKDITDSKASHHKTYDECSLANIFIRQQTGENLVKHELLSQTLLFLIPYNSIDLKLIIAFHSEHIPFLKSKYISAELRTCGLRAPPFVLS
ncbi:MAG: hypothetical protein LBE79_06435 [Tannerella sp.]|jgi:hypothetical protein|nr:hypothetical protein [Tannerella sp.]